MENEKNNKKGLVTLIVGIGILFALIFSATFAYFSVTSTNNFGSSTIDATAESIGTVTLNGTSSNLRLDLSAVDMMKGASDITYWGTSDGTPSTTQNVVTIGNTQVNGAGYFNCNYTLNVTATGTNNMYTAFQGMSGKSTEQIVLKIGDTKYDFNTSSLFPITINGALNGVTSSDVKSLTAEFYLVNKESVNQNAIQGTDITITITATSFSCSIGVKPHISASNYIINLASMSENSDKIHKYTGKVTDRYQDYGVGVDATNVFYVTSNDINNIIFQNYCWKIIRTTETGGVKLLYNGVPTSSNGNNVCPSSASLQIGNGGAIHYSAMYYGDNLDDKPAYVGYMYNPDSVNSSYYDQLRANNVNSYDSNLKYEIERWFKSSGIDASLLENAVYCNDRSLASNSPISEESLSASTSGNLYFANNNEKTTLECANQVDAFSVDNPKAGGNNTMQNVGFITAPEVNLIGPGVASGTWTGSPMYFKPNAPSIAGTSSSDMMDCYVDDQMAVRPAISVSSSVEITGGDGSTTNPFIVE